MPENRIDTAEVEAIEFKREIRGHKFFGMEHGQICSSDAKELKTVSCEEYNRSFLCLFPEGNGLDPVIRIKDASDIMPGRFLLEINEDARNTGLIVSFLVLLDCGFDIPGLGWYEDTKWSGYLPNDCKDMVINFLRREVK